MTPSSTKHTTLLALRHGGTHLIQPIIRQLTGKTVHSPKGTNALTCIPGPRLVVFLRDPRNQLVSHFRYKAAARIDELNADPGLADRELAAFLDRSKGGYPPIWYLRRWAKRWVTYRGAFVVRFEDMTERAGALHWTERLREYLEAPGTATQAVDYTLDRSGTYTGRHSRWAEWFGPESLAVWERHNGAILLQRMGYK